MRPANATFARYHADDSPSLTMRPQCGILSGWQVFDGIALAILFLAPLFMGGRHPVGRCAYVMLVFALLIAWLVNNARAGKIHYRLCGLEFIILLATGLIGIQLVPLPPQWLGVLSPRLAYYLPLWQVHSPVTLIDSWQTLSLAPAETRCGWAVWMAHAVFLLLMFQRLQTRDDVRRFVSFVGVTGLWLASVGILQYLFSNGKFLWVYEDPFRSTREVCRGPFYNENHFAHLLTLTLVPCWVLYRTRRNAVARERYDFTRHTSPRGELLTLLLGLAVPFILFAILLTRSRGGLLAVLATVCCAGLGLLRRERFERRHLARLTAVVVVLLIALCVHGLGDVRHEVQALASTSIDQLDEGGGRRQIWQAARGVVGQFTLLGAGVGSFRTTFPMFFPAPRNFDYSYAESGFWQVAVETGVCGVGLLAMAVWVLAGRVRQGWRAVHDEVDGEWMLAAIVGLVASVVHSIIDFVWYLPACFGVTLVLMAVVLRGSPQHKRPLVMEVPISRALSIASLMVVVAIGVLAMAPLCRAALGSGSWHAYLSQSRWLEASSEASAAEDPAALESLRRHLERAVQRDPDHAYAHMRLATVNLRLFEAAQCESDNPMSLAQIRDAALASQFATTEAQDGWLRAVMGDRRQRLDDAYFHVRRSLCLSPLQGVGYVYLAQLEFLQSPGVDVTEALIQQALRVRPYDATVLFAAGHEALLTGDLEQAVLRWRRAYHQDETLRRLITVQLAPRLPADVFVEQFRPNEAAMVDLVSFYQQQRLDSSAAIVARLLLDRLHDPARVEDDSAVIWRNAYSAAAMINDPRAVSIARRAVQLDPQHYVMRRRLAFELVHQQEWRAAIDELKWCREHNRADHDVVQKLAWAQSQLNAPSLQLSRRVAQ